MSDWFHVTSSRNRDSIRRHGLDWKHMTAARGIAGSSRPEQPGCFLCRDEHDIDWFVQMNNTGGPVDIWAVADVDEDSLVESPEGYLYTPRPIPPEQLTLIRQDIEPTGFPESEGGDDGPSGAVTVVFKSWYKPDDA